MPTMVKGQIKVALYMPPYLHQQVEALSIERGDTGLSETIRSLIQVGLAQDQEQKTGAPADARSVS